MANEVVCFPDTVKALCDWLRAGLADRGYDGVHVGTRVPDVRPATFVRLLATGGTRDIDPGVPLADVQVTVEAWANFESSAHDLAQLCRALIWAARGTQTAVTVARVAEVAGPGHQPDPLSAHHRFTATYLVRARGSAV